MRFHTTKMLAGAKASLAPTSNRRGLFLDLLLFLAVSVFSMIPQAIVSSVGISFLQSRLTASTASTNVLAEDLPPVYYVVIVLSSGFMILAAIFYCRIFERRTADTLGFGRADAIFEYAVGIGVGFAMITLSVLPGALTGLVSFGFSENADPLMILLFFLAFLLQGMGEEALFRGYLMTTLCRRTSLLTAILINSLLFSLFHLGNPGFTPLAFLNIFLFGIFASVLMLKRGSIWMVGAIHSIWNFAQGNLFGFSVSGTPKLDSILRAKQADRGTILHGGAFGPEGGLFVTALLLLATAIALFLPTKQSERVSISSEP